MTDNEQQQFATLLWAAQRIARKPTSIQHGDGPKDGYGRLLKQFPHSGGWTPDGQTCDCATCIAKDALERVAELRKETVHG